MDSTREEQRASRTLSTMEDWSSAGERGPRRRLRILEFHHGLNPKMDVFLLNVGRVELNQIIKQDLSDPDVKRL